MSWASGDEINTTTRMRRLSQSIPSSYTVWIDGSTFRAETNISGGTDFSGTDAATVIQAAIDALTTGGEIFVRVGDYPLSTRLVFDSDITFRGEGMRKTKFYPSANLGGADPYCLFDLTNCYYVNLSNFQIDGYNNTYLTHRGIGCETLTAYYHCDFNRVYFYNLQYGVYTGNGACNIHSSRFETIGKQGIADGYGVNLDGGYDYYIYGNNFTDCANDLYIGATDNVTAHFNTFRADTYWIAATVGSDHLSIQNNIVLSGSTSFGAITDYKICNNAGYITENAGTVTIPLGNASANVTHYLGSTWAKATPTQVLLTGTHTEVDLLYASAVGDTTFTVNASDGAVSADRQVYWRAIHMPV